MPPGVRPHTLPTIALDDETLAELGVFCGFDDDLAGEITAVSNRIRALLTQIHPAFERGLGPHLDRPAVADLLTGYPTPIALKAAGPGHVKAWLKKHQMLSSLRSANSQFRELLEQENEILRRAAAYMARDINPK